MEFHKYNTKTHYKLPMKTLFTYFHLSQDIGFEASKLNTFL